MKRHPLRSSTCEEPVFVSKEFLVLLDDLMFNVVLVGNDLIICISSVL